MKIEYKYPSTEELNRKIKIEFKNEFLKINNLKIGDEVCFEFPYHRIYKEPRKPEQRITWYKEMNGILKEDEHGFLYAESIEEMSFYKLNTDKKKEFYDHYYKKSKYNFKI